MLCGMLDRCSKGFFYPHIISHPDSLRILRIAVTFLQNTLWYVANSKGNTDGAFSPNSSDEKAVDTTAVR